MNKDAILARYDAELRRDLVIDEPGVRVEREPDAVRVVGPDASVEANCLVYVRPGDDVDAYIDAQIAAFARIGHGFEWKLHDHDQPSDLGARLERRGFRRGETDAVAVFDLTENGAPDYPLPAGLRVERLERPEQVAEIRRLLETVYDEDRSFIESMLVGEMATTPDAIRVYGVYDGALMVSAGWVRLYPNTAFASLWGGATLPDYRGRGVYKALVAVRARDAVARGYAYLQVDASPDSRPILERAGFEVVTQATEYFWEP